MASKVFSSNIATGSRANAMVADMKDADFKQLNPKIIASDAAIGGTPAIDTKLVYGSECEYIKGFRDTHVVQYDQRQIDSFLFETVNNECWQEYKKGHNLTVALHDKTEITGTRDIHVTGEDVENYDVHREITEPVKFETSNAKMEWTWFAIDTKGLLVEATVTKAAVEGVVATIEGAGVVNEVIKERLSGLNGKIAAFEHKAGAFCAKVIATYDAMPAPSIIAPCD